MCLPWTNAKKQSVQAFLPLHLKGFATLNTLALIEFFISSQLSLSCIENNTCTMFICQNDLPGKPSVKFAEEKHAITFQTFLLRSSTARKIEQHELFITLSSAVKGLPSWLQMHAVVQKIGTLDLTCFPNCIFLKGYP